jgi:hypothetical protein
MSDEEGLFPWENSDDGDEEGPDNTYWIAERVRLMFAEHFSKKYDALPPYTISIAVSLTLHALTMAPNDGQFAAQEPENLKELISCIEKGDTEG